MGALWIAHVKVTNEESYMKYAKLAGVAIADHGGKFIARGGRYVQLEGNDRPRNVVAKFPTLEDAVACYHSPPIKRRCRSPRVRVSATCWWSRLTNKLR